MTDTLSSHAADPINRAIILEDVSTLEELGSSLDEVFETADTAAELNRHNLRRVALQFPDELLQYSVPIYRSLKAKAPEKEFYVMADTSYGSCCVDEVAAQHVDAEAVVHYGHACLSPTTRLPTYYVFPRKPIDVSDCVQSLIDISGLKNEPPAMPEVATVVVMLDVAYHYQADSILEILAERLPESLSVNMWKLLEHFVPSESGSKRPSSPVEILSPRAHTNAPHNRHALPQGLTIRNSLILYVGGETLALNNVLMTNSASTIYSYDPTSRLAKLESSRSNRLMMRRYAMVHKARDAAVFGILIGTLGVAQYLPVITHLRRIIAQSRRKSYTVSVGKLNPSKLANFMEIDCFVLVACPENSIIDSKEFLRPVVTPYELLAALGPEEIQWPAGYSLDFEEVLAVDSDKFNERPQHNEDLDRPTFSLVSGTYRDGRRYEHKGSCFFLYEDPPADRTSDALSTRSPDNMISLATQGAAVQYLQGRSYQGLEQNIGIDEPSVLEQGRSGVAQGYSELT